MKSSETAATPYGVDFYLEQRDGSHRSARAVIPLILQTFPARSVVDLGCGVGTWLSVVRESGIEDVVGMDGDYVDQAMLQIPQAQFIATDLREALPLHRSFDLALCLEVAEHLPSDFAATLVKNLTLLAPVVVFSAAIPGQGGTDHVNEQWQDYWRELFAARGYVAYDAIRAKIWKNDEVDFWYRQNLVCYAREGYEVHPSVVPVAPDASLNFVHPGLLEITRQEAAVYFSKAVSMLPGLFGAAVRRRLGVG